MSAVLITGVAILAVALVVFLVLVIKDPGFVRRILKLKIGLGGIELELAVSEAERTVAQKEGRMPDRRRLQQHIERISPSTRVLWVDDNPANNSGETRVLKARGLEVDTALTNDEAVSAVSDKEYDLVITDITRRHEVPANAGLELPARLRDVLGELPPIVYYTGHAASPRTPDGYPVTDVPSALFDAIQSALSLSGRSG